MKEAPYNLDNFLLATTVLLLLSFIGGAVQFKEKRIACALSFALLSGAAIIEIALVRPLVTLVITKKGPMIANLLQIAFYHAILMGSLLSTCFLQISTDKEDVYEIEDEDEVKKKPKSKKSKTDKIE